MVIAGTVAFALGLFALIGAEFPEVYQPQNGYAFNHKKSLKGSQLSAPGSSHRTLDEHGFPVTPSASAPVPFAHPAMTGNARMAAGSYPLGDGWVIQVVATDAETVNVRCCIDPAWLPADQAAFEAPHDSMSYAGTPSPKPFSFRGRPLLIGAPKSAAVGEGLALEWRDRGEVVHVHVGSAGDDRFVRAPDATRCLYLGFGGDDRVVVTDSADEYSRAPESVPVLESSVHAQAPESLPNDRMVEADRKLTRVVPQASGGTSSGSSTNRPIIMEGN